jgi:hypothetical protein
MLVCKEAGSEMAREHTIVSRRCYNPMSTTYSAKFVGRMQRNRASRTGWVTCCLHRPPDAAAQAEFHKGQYRLHQEEGRSMMERDGRPQGPTSPHPHRPRPYYTPIPVASCIGGATFTACMLCSCLFQGSLRFVKRDSVCLVRVYTGYWVKSNLKVFVRCPLTLEGGGSPARQRRRREYIDEYPSHMCCKVERNKSELKSLLLKW